MKKFLPPFITLILLAILAYFILPFRFSFPITAHEHFLFQIYYNENRLDLSAPEFQITSDPYSCSDGISPEPMHFHDGNPEVVHLHWAGLTGRDFLKYYGFLGNKNTLGYRWDHFPKVQSIAIQGQLLPDPKNDEKVWIFHSDTEGNIEQMDYKDFLNRKLSQSIAVAEAHGEEEGPEALEKMIMLIQPTEPNIDFVIGQFETFLEVEEGNCNG